MKTIYIVAVLMVLLMAYSVSAEDAPAMYFVPGDGDGTCGEETTIDLMVNTSEVVYGTAAHVHFDPLCVNITDVDYTGSPWQPLGGIEGWSSQGDYVILGTVGMSGPVAGVYKVATLTVDCVGDECTSNLGLTNVSPLGTTAYNGSFTCTASKDSSLPEMSIVQNGEDIDVMVTTYENASRVKVCVHANPAELYVDDMNFTDCPWQIGGDTWTTSGEYSSFDVLSADPVTPGTYKVVTLDVESLVEYPIAVWLIDPIVGNHFGTDEVNLTDMTYIPVVIPDDPEVAEISIGNGTGVCTIPVMVNNATNVGAVFVSLAYDPNIVVVTDVTSGDMDEMFPNMQNADIGSVSFMAWQNSVTEMNGLFALANIEFAPVAESGESLLTLTVTTFIDGTPEVNTMNFTVSNGMYTVMLNGDVNSDGIVDVSDVMFLAKHILGIDGFETINEPASDVTGDGVIDAADVMFLAKHVAGITGFETLR